jgi:hypothetical protein
LAETFPQLDPLPLQSLVASGRLSQEEYAALRAEHARLTAGGQAFALTLIFMTCGVKR